MGAPGGFDQTVRHQRAGGNNRIHDAAIDEFGDDESLLGHGHGAGQGHYHETILVARHGFEHVGGFADLASGEGGLAHGAHQVVDRVHFLEIERLQRNQPVLNRIVQLALDSGAIVIACVSNFSSKL